MKITIWCTGCPSCCQQDIDKPVMDSIIKNDRDTYCWTDGKVAKWRPKPDFC